MQMDLRKANRLYTLLLLIQRNADSLSKTINQNLINLSHYVTNSTSFFRNCSVSLDLQVAVKLFHKMWNGLVQWAVCNKWVRVMGGGRRISHFTRDYTQTTGYVNRKVGVCHLTYGEVPDLTEFITANMSDRFIWMIKPKSWFLNTPQIQMTN